VAFIIGLSVKSGIKSIRRCMYCQFNITIICAIVELEELCKSERETDGLTADSFIELLLPRFILCHLGGDQVLAGMDMEDFGAGA
jgi:hypothetical protein